MEDVKLDGRSLRVWKNGPKTLGDVFAAAVAFGDKTFLVNEVERISFDAFGRAALALSRRLVEAGLKPGDRMAICMRNLPEWPVAFYAATLAGAVATPLNAWWSADELAHALDNSGAVVVVFDSERLERVQSHRPDCLAGRVVFVCRRSADPAARGLDLEDIIGPPQAWASLPPIRPLPAPVELIPEQDATLFYTSGTAGRPKGAAASHRAATTAIFNTLFSQARAFVRRGEALPTPNPCVQKGFVVCIPFFHVTGCFALLNVAMVSGMKLTLMRRFEPEAAMRLVEQERATAIGGVPTIAWQLLDHPARANYDLSSLDSITYGGAPAAPELTRRIPETWPAARLGTGWGMTETSATFTHHFGEDYAHRPDSCGPASPVGDMKVVDARGHSLSAGQTGELWVRGPGVVRGYWNNPDATAKTFEDGWLKTGDLARIDEEGFCYIVDRLKDVIIRGGENIYSVEVEDVLYSHPAVTDAALVAIPHPTLGEEPGAVVSLRPGEDVTPEALQTHVRARLAGYKTPVRILISQTPLPRNPAGKLLKGELKRLFLPSTAARTEPAPGHSDRHD